MPSRSTLGEPVFLQIEGIRQWIRVCLGLRREVFQPGRATRAHLAGIFAGRCAEPEQVDHCVFAGGQPGTRGDNLLEPLIGRGRRLIPPVGGKKDEIEQDREPEQAENDAGENLRDFHDG